MKPTFLIIGTQKGGTSAGIFYLNQHADVFMPKGEPHFFDEHYDKGIEWYENQFFNGNKHYIRKQQRGEKTPIYCFFNHSTSLDCVGRSLFLEHVCMSII
jgi:hypothetical protein